MFVWLVGGGGVFSRCEALGAFKRVNRNGGSSAALKLCRGSLRAYEDGN